MSHIDWKHSTTGKAGGNTPAIITARDEEEAYYATKRANNKTQQINDELKKSERLAAIRLPKFEFEAHDMNKRPYTDKK